LQGFWLFVLMAHLPIRGSVAAATSSYRSLANPAHALTSPTCRSELRSPETINKLEMKLTAVVVFQANTVRPYV